MFLFFYRSGLTCLVQLLCLGKLSIPKCPEFSLVLLDFPNARILNAKLLLYYFTYLLFNLQFIKEQ